MVTRRQQIDQLLADYRVAQAQYKTEQGLLIEAENRLSFAEEAQQLLQQVAQTVQQEIHTRVAGLVSRCLDTVFDEPYTFRIDFEQKRGRTEAVLCFERNGLLIDPLSASGGGAVDVAAFALRLACLMLRRPRGRRVLIMDEPFRFLSEEYRGRVRELLLVLAEELEVQFIMVTHAAELRCGKVVDLA